MIKMDSKKKGQKGIKYGKKEEGRGRERGRKRLI